MERRGAGARASRRGRAALAGPGSPSRGPAPRPASRSRPTSTRTATARATPRTTAVRRGRTTRAISAAPARSEEPNGIGDACVGLRRRRRRRRGRRRAPARPPRRPDRRGAVGERAGALLGDRRRRLVRRRGRGRAGRANAGLAPGLAQTCAAALPWMRSGGSSRGGSARMRVGQVTIFQNPERARPIATSTATTCRLATLAEPLGFQSIWGVEHHFTDYTMCPDVLQLLTYFAAQERDACSSARWWWCCRGTIRCASPSRCRCSTTSRTAA